MLRDLFHRKGLRFVATPWTNSTKELAYSDLRHLLEHRRLILPTSDPKLRTEMLGIEERIMPSGAYVYNARGSRKDDRVATIITALTNTKHMAGSPRSFCASMGQEAVTN